MGSSAQRHTRVFTSFFLISTGTWRIPEKRSFSPTLISMGCTGCGHEDVSHNDAGRSDAGFQSKTDSRGINYSGNDLVTMVARSQGKPTTMHFKICLCLPFNITLAGSSSIPCPKVTERILEPTLSVIHDLQKTPSHREAKVLFPVYTLQRAESGLTSIHFPSHSGQDCAAPQFDLSSEAKIKKYCSHPWWR